MALKFHTKRELLRHLGKNENDRKLVDRLMVRGKVHMENGIYVLVDKDADIEYYKLLVNEKEKEIKNLNSKIVELENELENVQPSEDNSELLHKIYVYIKQVLHINIRYDDLLEFVENCPSD